MEELTRIAKQRHDEAIAELERLSAAINHTPEEEEWLDAMVQKDLYGSGMTREEVERFKDLTRDYPQYLAGPHWESSYAPRR